MRPSPERLSDSRNTKLNKIRGSIADNSGVIMTSVKLSEMKTNDELIAEQLHTDPAFRAEWERTALARAVAVAIVRYRAEHDLSQRELANRLGMKQPQVARLELGEVNPSIDTLMRISAQLGIEFTIDVRPAGTPARNVTKRAQANGLVGSYRTEQSEILVVADRSARLMNT
jgi:transcriptional regulator with XRE-family HTH domain